MVHITSQLFVLAALITSSCALHLSKRSTAADVEADLKNISTQVTTLDNAINSFPSTCSLILALAIHSDAAPLISAINQATTDTNDVSPAPLSEDNGAAIITQVQGIQPIIIDALKRINLSEATSALEAGLIAAVPADILANATAIQTAINAAFSSACATYGSGC
ncbi:hypothetical protein PILCRDRAFT_10023 [Piloderma croceum F 1598]|uniref:Hydrophobic surface binding protein n=1 Tax=Piloderma croceum (strain F 1598) TaxID=765440 RepID=A0A0C3FJ92_PILCF|nr:hypothetical protein PILCRDRAFT_10023 [Piloderma croceum F 1598]